MLLRLLLLLLLPCCGFAQQVLRFPAAILSTATSTDQQRIAATTKDSAYIIDAASFRIIRQWKHGQAYPVVLGFHPTNPDLLLLQRNTLNAKAIPAASDYEKLLYYRGFQKTWQENPEDSITLWNTKTATLLRTATGSFFFQFTKTEGAFAGVMNQVFSYPYQGATAYSAKSAELVTNDGTNNKTNPIPKACRRLLLDPTEKVMAISWYNGFINNQSTYSFDLFSFPQQELLLRIDSLPGLISEYSFSTDGRQLAVCGTFSNSGKPAIRIYDLKNFRLQQEIPFGGSQPAFSSDGAYLQFLSEDGNWYQWDLLQQKPTQKIWSSLTTLFAFDNYCAAGNQLFFFGSAWAGVPFASEKHFQLEAIRPVDLKLFSTINDPVTQSLSDSNSFTLQLNAISEASSLSRPDIRFNSNRSIFSATRDNQLQVWNARQRKKVLEQNFTRAIKAFPDRSGNSFLVVEDNGQQSYSEYRMHRISLQENTLFSSGVLQQTDSSLNGSSGRCDCKPDPQADQSWICSDGSGSIWSIGGPQLRQQKLLSVKDLAITGWQLLSDGALWLLGMNEKEERSIWKGNLQHHTASFVQNTQADRFLALQQGLWTWNSKQDSALQYWENGALHKSLTLSGRIIRLDQWENGDLFVQLERGNEQYWQRIRQQDSLPAQRTAWISARFYPLDNQSFLAEAGNLHSVVSNGALTITWTRPSTRILSNTNFDVSASGRFLLIGNHAMDLKELTQTELNKYNPALLLSDSSGLQWVELLSETDYSNRKAAFTLQRIANNGKDTLRSKQWVRGTNVDPFGFNHERIFSSPDNKWLLTLPEAGKGKESPPVLWNLQTLDPQSIGSGKENSTAWFAADGKTLRVSSYTLTPDGMQKKETIEEYTVQPLKKLRQWQRTVPLNNIQMESKDQFRINTRNVEWYQTEKDSTVLKRRYFSRDYLEYVTVHEASGLIVAGAGNGAVHIWERDGASSPIATLSAHHAAVVSMKLRGNRLFTLGADGSLTIIDIPGRKILVRMITLQQEQGISIALYTPEGYYKADPAIAPLLHFVKNGAIYPLTSFDYQGNRPDKVYASIGLSEPSLIQLLQQSWEARLRRAGITAATKPEIPVYPAVDWDRSAVPPLVRDSIFQLKLRVKDALTSNNTLFIRINGVPAGSQRGFTVPASPNPALQEFPLRLNEGKNRISVSALNAKGQESVEQEFEVYYQPERKKVRRVFYAGVGVSTYKDSTYTLRYAAKDVEDIAEKIRPYFDSVITFTLTNEAASRNNILQLHQWLQQTGTDDIVILSLSGHGLIQAGKGFFFAPHEMDFNDPAATGVSMNDLESLLDDIPARRRLLLLDACHSGEEWNDTTLQRRLPPGVSITRGGKIGKTGSSGNAPKRQSFLLMKELFSDLSRGNGSFMISAAGSTEFAYEGKEWKNGVFSRSFLEALQELRYRDSFKGAQPFPVSELRRLIYEKVSALTRGLQNPTSRQENGWWDWEL